MHFSREYFTPIRLLTFFCGLVIAAGIFLRLYNLTFPDKQVFDEVYFPVFANNYLEGVYFYDVHPPLGKFVIAVGIFLFGNNGLGWRIMPALFGVATIGLMGYVAWRLFKDKVAAVLVAALIAFDGIFILYSRVGLMDGILFFAIFAALLTAIVLTKQSSAVFCGLAIGVVTAIKWPAAFIVIPMLLYAHKVGRVRELLYSIPLGVFVYFIIVYAGQIMIGEAHPFREAFQWNISAFNYHHGLSDSHPWGSAWWSWPIPLKPVLFLYDTLPNGAIHIQTTLGNPLVWLASTAAVVWTFVYLLGQLILKKIMPWNHSTFPLLIGYLVMWLPWAFVDRVIFLYHYLPAYGFALLLLCYWLSEFWKTGYRVVLFWLLAAVLIVGISYLPLSLGWISVTPDMLSRLILIHSWLY